MAQSDTPGVLGCNEELGAGSETCESCRYWKLSDVYRGECRRYPPTLDMLQVKFARDSGYSDDDFAENSIIWWTVPATAPDEWCGEYALAPNV
jgi:hypothetical protein